MSGQQQQHIDIGMGKQFAAAKAADGDQTDIRRKAGALPEQQQGGVGVPGQLFQHAVNAARGRAAAAQRREQGGFAGPVVLAKLAQIAQIGHG